MKKPKLSDVFEAFQQFQISSRASTGRVKEVVTTLKLGNKMRVIDISKKERKTMAQTYLVIHRVYTDESRTVKAERLEAVGGTPDSSTPNAWGLDDNVEIICVIESFDGDEDVEPGADRLWIDEEEKFV